MELVSPNRNGVDELFFFCLPRLPLKLSMPNVWDSSPSPPENVYGSEGDIGDIGSECYRYCCLYIRMCMWIMIVLVTAKFSFAFVLLLLLLL